MHGRGVLRPVREAVCVERNVLLVLANNLGVLVEENGAVSRLEAVDALFRGGEVVTGDGLQDLLGELPELVVLILEQDDNASGLRVEGGGNVQDGGLDDLLNLRVRDRRGLGELVDGAAGREGGENVGRHDVRIKWMK